MKHEENTLGEPEKEETGEACPLCGCLAHPVMRGPITRWYCHNRQCPNCDPDSKVEETGEEKGEKPDFNEIADNDPSILNHDVYTGFVHGAELGWKMGQSENARLSERVKELEEKIAGFDDLLDGMNDQAKREFADLESSCDQFAILFSDYRKKFEKEDGRDHDAAELLELYKESLKPV